MSNHYFMHQSIRPSRLKEAYNDTGNAVFEFYAGQKAAVKATVAPKFSALKDRATICVMCHLTIRWNACCTTLSTGKCEFDIGIGNSANIELSQPKSLYNNNTLTVTCGWPFAFQKCLWKSGGRSWTEFTVWQLGNAVFQII